MIDANISLREPLLNLVYLYVKDKWLKAKLYLNEASARMSDVSVELEGIYEILLDVDNLTHEQKYALTSLRKTIILFVSGSSFQIETPARVLAPIYSISYVHNCNEVKRKNGATIKIHDDRLTKKIYY